MSLTNFRTLGRSGLVVSPMCLGTMTFGTPGWGADEATARAIFDAYRDAGGNFIDTADIYSSGKSEEMVGRFIADTGSRDNMVLATKFAFNGQPGNPNAGGNGAKNIHRALEGSLRRLATDYIDLYWMHIWDGVTPVAEVLQTLGDLVRSGKIRYFAFSDMPAWLAMKAATIADLRGIPGPIAMQLEYSLIERSIEREHIPVAQEAGMALMPWSPLGGGFLTGKYDREAVAGKGRLSGTNPFGQSKFNDRNWAILEALRVVAAEQEQPLAQVALAWVMTRQGVTSTIIGASKVTQLKDNLAALQIALTPEQIDRLTTTSALPAGFTDGLGSAAVQHMIFGGHTVEGWL
jgi:aryl-alcohol dehydrogenase-like predicted oxidoreductase